MDRTPERPRRDAADFAIAPDSCRSPLRSPRRSPRIKKNPSVTPNRFNKFFNPRPRNARRGSKVARKVLQDLSAVKLNSRAANTPHLDLPTSEQSARSNKKRKLSFASITSLPSSPIKKVLEQDDEDDATQQEIEGSDGAEQVYPDTDEELSEGSNSSYHSRITPYRAISTSAGLLSRQLGVKSRRTAANDSTLWQHEAAHFYSTPEDSCYYHNSIQRFLSLPFCVASFKQSPLVAVGDEDGHIRVHQTYDNNNRYKFAEVLKSWRPHDNAIMDLEISSDDRLLATASGDQTCHIYDIEQGISVNNLVGHNGSVKRIQFQPGSGNQILASCSRDGNVFLWDRRGPQASAPINKSKTHHLSWDVWSSTLQIQPVNEIYEAHTSHDRLKRPKGWRHPGRIPARYDYAITTCTFVGESRPHLLATASENDAIIKLWDIRTQYHEQSGRPTPVSATLEPLSHVNHRQFGVTSMSMNNDGSRLYAACRDHTVYAYSTSHLVLGGASEMSISSSQPSKVTRTPRQGMGPLYGFRHPSLSIVSFYDKVAVSRNSCGGDWLGNTSELLAVGSGHEGPVIFPTDEVYLNKAVQQPPTAAGESCASSGAISGLSKPHVENEDCPIYYHGTPLVGGHKKEVTALAWTTNGNLVTVADDHTSRCWRQDPDKARALRLNIDRDMVRHNSGWSQVSPGFDDDE